MGYRELDGQRVGVLAILERLRVPLEDTSPPVLRRRRWRAGCREGHLCWVVEVGEVRVPVENGEEDGVGGELVVDGSVGLLCWCLWTPECATDFGPHVAGGGQVDGDVCRLAEGKGKGER